MRGNKGRSGQFDKAVAGAAQPERGLLVPDDAEAFSGSGGVLRQAAEIRVAADNDDPADALRAEIALRVLLYLAVDLVLLRAAEKADVRVGADMGFLRPCPCDRVFLPVVYPEQIDTAEAPGQTEDLVRPLGAHVFPVNENDGAGIIVCFHIILSFNLNLIRQAK